MDTDYSHELEMTQIWETKLTPEQEAAKVARIILFKNFFVDYDAQKTFSETFESLGTTLSILLTDPPHKWYTGTRLFLGDTALELTFDGGNMESTFIRRVLYPVWETVCGSILLMNATARMDDWIFNRHLQYLKSHRQTLKAFNGDHFPVVVAALKTNYAEQFSREELGILLNSPRQAEFVDQSIVMCDPADRESVKEVLLTVLELGLSYLDDPLVIEL